MVAGCFAELRQIHSVRRSEQPSTLETLVVSLVLTRLDYGNATLAGIQSNLLRHLRAVQNVVLPLTVLCSPLSLTAFRRQLKTFLFRVCYPDS